MESLLLSIASTLLALVVVLALAYAVLRVLRRPLLSRQGRAGEQGDAMTFVRALPVGPKERVVLIDYRGARWMLGVTAGGITVLESWPDAASGAAARAASAGEVSTSPSASTPTPTPTPTSTSTSVPAPAPAPAPAPTSDPRAAPSPAALGPAR